MLSRTFITGLLFSAGAFAQMASFPKPSYFREVFERTNTKVDLREPARLKDFVIGGKLTLSLKDYIDLVMANNTQMQVQFLTLEVPKNNIVSVFGKWDPTASASFSSTRQTSVPTNPATAGTATLGSVSKSLSQPLNLGYSQTLDTGLSYQVNFSGSKSSYSNSRSSYNPSISSGLTFQVSQPLLQNRGRYVNRIPVLQAQSVYKQTDYGMLSTILNLVNTAENAYWNLISARESLRVAVETRDASKTNFEFVQKQLALGAIAELDIYNPEGQLAAAEVSVSQAEFNLARAEDSLRLQIAADLDPEIRKLPIDLTEAVEAANTSSLSPDPEAEVQKALSINPSVRLAMEKIGYDDLGIQSAKNGLLPNLSFTARYSSAGQGGIYIPSQSTLLGGETAQSIPGGLADALSQMFGFGYPTYMGSLTLTLPIRNRTASMTMASALVTKRSDALNLRNTQEQTRLSVVNAVTNVKGAIEQLKLAKIQLDIQRKNVDAQNLEYQLGTNTNQDVVLALQAFASADAQLVSSQVGVRTAILNLYTQTGELLDERGIVIK
jgi:outer membrane protein TolC